MNTDTRKKRLKELIDKYSEFKNAGKLDLSSEETIRVWINDFLEIFDWNVRDTSQVLQEKVLSKEEKEKLTTIGSTSTRPDYTFVFGREKLTFLDAKGIHVNLNENADAAFQIKSYGWSVLASCAFITNFEEFVIYDCTYTPDKNQKAEFGRIYLKISEYIDNFDVLENHLLKQNILQGKLKEIYQDTLKSVRNIEKTTPDFKFAKQLSEFRLHLATNILSRNKAVIEQNTELLSYIVQVIINRVIFIRVCEARKIEKENLLLEFCKSGFWDNFKKSSYTDFYNHYDGPLFEKIKLLQEIEIDNDVFNELTDLLYYPSPYRFDVIPTNLLSDIYEIFLSKKLIISGKKVTDELKLEYTKTTGAVCTPNYLVRDLIMRTLKSSYSRISIKDFFNFKILDFACGSGVFLIEIFEYLENELKTIFELSELKGFDDYFIKSGDFIELTLHAKREIISHCIFATDIDPEAVEVARMSLSLKVIDTDNFYEKYTELGVFGDKILNNVGKNIKCGNSLIPPNIQTKYPDITEEQLFKTNPFDWQTGFKSIFEEHSGFDFILTNPPYVEVKNYNVDFPEMHRYIKSEYETTKNGKIDLSVAFIEQAVKLLKPTGELGLIVQKRFFKTEYGKKIRNFIGEKKLLSQILDFEATDIFIGRITYIASFILDKREHDNFYYKKIAQKPVLLPVTLDNLPIWEDNAGNFVKLPLSVVGQNAWNFDDAELLKFINELKTKNGTLGDFAKVRVGIQVLWDKAYHLKVKHFNDDNTILVDTHIEDNVTVEVDACRPLIVNENFFPFKAIQPDTYVLFPYETSLTQNEPILFDDYCRRFPLAGEYLNKHKNTIVSEVETWDDDQKWHLFTRVQNHKSVYPKVLIPMTANDTYASITQNNLHYCDNANMFFIDLPDKSEDNLFAFSGIINSSLFSVCARAGTNPQSNGYYKFNKQFIEPVPFPCEEFECNTRIISELSAVSREIKQKQTEYVNATPRQQNIIHNILTGKWSELDNLVFDLYNATPEQRDFFANKGRNIDRINLLDRNDK